MVSPIREATTHQVVLENPTDFEVKIERNQFTLVNENAPPVGTKPPAKGQPVVDTSLDNDNIEILPLEFVLKPHETKEFTIKYRPLMTTEKDDYMLTLKNAVLGDYKFKLMLKAIQPSTQRSLAFKCPLGQDQTQPFKFTHFLKKQTNYAIKIERLDGPGLCDFKADVA